MRKIKLTQDKYALVDDKDFEYLNQFKWCFNNGYAVRRKSKRGGMIFMHRIIIDTPKKMDTDHKNRNRLDNRKENLRICTRGENITNRPKQKNNTSGYTGVFWDRNRWIVSIGVKGKSKFVGRYKSKIDAAEAYNKAALYYHKEFAKLNTLKAKEIKILTNEYSK